MSPQPADPDATDHQRRRHELRNTLTQMRLQTQLLRRLARQQDGPAWRRMADGLAAIDASISTLARRLTEDEPR
jgi:hypothetical protein